MFDSTRSAGILRERGRAGVAAQSGRVTTIGGPPAATRSIAALARASASEFWARGTWAAIQPPGKPWRTRSASAHSVRSLASLTRQRPWSCSTMRFESSSSSTRSAPSSAARVTARTTPTYSATLLVRIPRYSEIVASGRARGSRASGRSSRNRTAPADAGPGLPRAAPSVRMRKPGPRGSGRSPDGSRVGRSLAKPKSRASAGSRSMRRSTSGAPRSPSSPRGSPG